MSDPGWKKRREERVKAGLCQQCGNPREGTIRLCVSCHARRKTLRKNSPSESPAKKHQYKLKEMYGITPKDFEELWVSHAGRCGNPGCRKPLELGVSGYAIDHCHTTNKVRGLLCCPCNVAIGMLDEDEAKFIGAMEYLRG